MRDIPVYRKIRIGKRIWCVDVEQAHKLARRVGTFLFYAVLAGIGIALFRWGHAYATRERGYIAIGGEMFFLLLPLLWWMFSNIVKDTIRDVSDLMRSKPEPQPRQRGTTIKNSGKGGNGYEVKDAGGTLPESGRVLPL